MNAAPFRLPKAGLDAVLVNVELETLTKQRAGTAQSVLEVEAQELTSHLLARFQGQVAATPEVCSDFMRAVF